MHQPEDASLARYVAAAAQRRWPSTAPRHRLLRAVALAVANVGDREWTLVHLGDILTKLGLSAHWRLEHGLDGPLAAVLLSDAAFILNITKPRSTVQLPLAALLSWSELKAARSQHVPPPAAGAEGAPAPAAMAAANATNSLHPASR
jgi:hypothetical protein